MMPIPAEIPSTIPPILPEESPAGDSSGGEPITGPWTAVVFEVVDIPAMSANAADDSGEIITITPTNQFSEVTYAFQFSTGLGAAFGHLPENIPVDHYVYTTQLNIAECLSAAEVAQALAIAISEAVVDMDQWGLVTYDNNCVIMITNNEGWSAPIIEDATSEESIKVTFTK